MRPRDIGTRTETAVVRYLRANGWPNAERRVRTVHVTPRLPVRLTLADAVTVLREGGWGEPLNQEATA